MPIHSNYSIRWQNYRRFEDTDWIEIKPLTILIGPNNSGKSSILSPLLLMDQTLSSTDDDAALVSRGRVFDGGNYADLVHRHDVERDIRLALRFHVHKLVHGADPVGAYPPGSLDLRLGRGDT